MLWERSKNFLNNLHVRNFLSKTVTKVDNITELDIKLTKGLIFFHLDFFKSRGQHLKL